MHAHTVAFRIVLHTDGEDRLGSAFAKAEARIRAALPDVVKIEVVDGDCGQQSDVFSLPSDL